MFAVASVITAVLSLDATVVLLTPVVLIGVNIGPNLTCTGSLATLLWRRVLQGYDKEVPLGEFTRLGVATVLPSLVLCVTALWLGLRVKGA